MLVEEDEGVEAIEVDVVEEGNLRKRTTLNAIIAKRWATTRVSVQIEKKKQIMLKMMKRKFC